MEPERVCHEETLKIDPAGDVLFIVGSSPPKARLLISSKILSLASPVFAAMFSLNFKEGSNLSSDSPSEVLLPDDDPEAMTVLCNCLHFRSDKIPRNVEFLLLRSLAVLCDKYDCATAISAWCTLWLQRWETDKCEDGFEGLLIVIYALDCAEAFTKATKKALLEQVGSFDTHKVLDGLDTVPLSLIVDIEARRGAVQASLHTAMENAATTMLTDECNQKTFWPHAYLHGLKKASLWPLSQAFREQSLANIMARIYYIPEVELPFGGYGGGRCSCKVCRNPYWHKLRHERAQHMSLIIGQCLDCVRGGGSKAKGGECRVSHS